MQDAEGKRKFFCSAYEVDDESRTVQTVFTSHDISQVQEAVTTGRFPDPEPDEDIAEDRHDQAELDDEDDIALNLEHFYSSLGKYYELSYIGGRLDNVFTSAYFKGGIQAYLEQVSSSDTLIGTQTIHEVDFTYFPELQRRLARWDTIQDGINSYYPALLLGIVASYDSLFAEIFKTLLSLRPERYDSSDRQIVVSDLLKLNSFEELIDRVIADEVETICSKSHVDQIASFEKNFSISVQEKFESWPVFVELFERRNLAAHGDLRVDAKYLQNCKKGGVDVKSVKVGDLVRLDQEYINNTLDVLIDIGTRLVFAAWVKQISAKRDKAFAAVVNASFNFIKAGRFELALQISEFVIKNYSAQGSDSDLKAIHVNRAIALKKLGKADEASAALKEQDWTASAAMYKICVAAILEQVDQVTKLLPAVQASEELSIMEFREWSAFDWVRDKIEFNEAFERTFGEALVQSKLTETVRTSSETSSDVTPLPLPAPHPSAATTVPDTAR